MAGRGFGTGCWAAVYVDSPIRRGLKPREDFGERVFAAARSAILYYYGASVFYLHIAFVHGPRYAPAHRGVHARAAPDKAEKPGAGPGQIRRRQTYLAAYYVFHRVGGFFGGNISLLVTIMRTAGMNFDNSAIKNTVDQTVFIIYLRLFQ